MIENSDGRSVRSRRSFLEEVYRDALAAVDSAVATRRALAEYGEDLFPTGPGDSADVAVLAIGKAAGPMACEAAAWLEGRLVSGLAITRDEMNSPPSSVEHLRGDHPIPGERSAVAARRTREWLAARGAGETVLVLLSGGASALLAGSPPGLPMSDITEMNRVLLASGAGIDQVNRVRRQVLPCAGGRLARATSAKRIEVLAISDVPGDRLEVIGSGPFVEIQEPPSRTIASLKSSGVWSEMPGSVARWLEAQSRGGGERPRGAHSSEPQVRHRVIASNRDALAAAVTSCRRNAVKPIVVSTDLRGEARVVGHRLGRLGAALSEAARPICLIAGGETTVTLRGGGRGGRSQELALAAALALEGAAEVALLAAGTDGSDGPTDAAGAVVDGWTIERGLQRGVRAQSCLGDNDAYSFFDAEGGLVRTGPTGTNVMDLVFVYADRTRNV